MSKIIREKDVGMNTPDTASEQYPGHDVASGEVQSVQVDKPFSLWSTLGISFSVTSTPLAVGTYLSVVIGVGGSPVFFYGYILAVCLDMCICASLAEMAAQYPHSSGQIYWTAKLAPRGRGRSLSYLVGWLTAAGYFFWTSAALLISSQLIWALVQICHPTFITLPWHLYVGYFAVGVFTLLPNIPFFKWYPQFLKGLVIYINAGALFVLIVLLVRAKPKQSSNYVFKAFVNQTGWSSNGVVFFLGLLPGLTAVNGFDSAAHMAEELPRPERQVPQVMFISALASAASGLPMILVYMFCITKPDNLLNPVGGQPVIQLMVDSLESFPLTIVGSLVFITCFLCASVTMMTTFSRIWWSLARDGGVPFSPFMARISGRWKVPVNSVCFSAFACILIGLLKLGSATALNAILGTAVLCIFASYAIPILCSLVGKRSGFASAHYFNLGHVFGTVLNYISVFWICFVFVWLCFPPYIPATMDTMNWAIVVFSVVCATSGMNWLAYSRIAFEEPKAISQ
ncbi:hypothetical protein N7481_001494 [Penicillium waksmanii]|uniref:uncharacterized protein n=1 Tax=Penicillium waksmanii TaxID=69791 RepID=UPI0025496340|nr:uncharacterized protein N7481_001494 [Penicillium waksmanii]KAJ6001085.1 hypothetical protein N7481_001494 [Penicillium waksmanii]